MPAVMSSYYSTLLARAQRRGFVGPHYSGLLGKFRFLGESVLYRNEFILTATPRSTTEEVEPAAPELVLHAINSAEELEPYTTEFDAAYHPGYTRSWPRRFEWGERAFVGTVNGKLACYNWLQEGTRGGYSTYYGRLFEHEARVLRAAVLPEFRGLGLNRVMKRAILRSLYDAEIERVYVEVYQHNVPSLKSLLRVGFQPMGMIAVIEAWPLKEFIRWRSQEQMVSALEALGLAGLIEKETAVG